MTRLVTIGECADQVKVDRVTIYRLACLRAHWDIG
jgi:hypothetical protein